MAHIHNSNVNRMPRLPSIQPRHRSCSIFDKTTPGSYKRSCRRRNKISSWGSSWSQTPCNFFRIRPQGISMRTSSTQYHKNQLENAMAGSPVAHSTRQLARNLHHVASRFQWSWLHLSGCSGCQITTACDYCSKGGVMSPSAGAATWQSAAPCISARTGAQFLKEK